MLGLLKLVFVLFAPLRRELAFEGMLEHGLAIDLELPARRLQALDALVEFGKQFLDLGNDAVLFGQWGQVEFKAFHERLGNGFECRTCSLARYHGFYASEEVQEELRPYPPARMKSCQTTTNATLVLCEIGRSDWGSNRQKSGTLLGDLVGLRAVHVDRWV